MIAVPGLRAQAAPSSRELSVFTRARQVAANARSAIWPGFRPDTIPLQFVLPERGSLLLGWTGAAPTGYTRLSGGTDGLWIPAADRGAASTATALESRTVAQVVVTDTSLSELAGLIAHESFHAFEHSVKHDGAKFGGGENSYYVSQYPVYDIANETQFALELAVLKDALEAKTAESARERARQFVAVRFARQHNMDTNVAEFEAMSELNEGLAEYALLRGSAAAPSARPAVASLAARLATLLTTTNLSVRLRYYVTGSGQALLLDRIGPADWKRQLMTRNVTLQDLLAESAGAPTSPALIAAAMRDHPVAALEAAARTRVSALQSRVRARADSLMHLPGVHFTLDGSVASFGSCGFDPQNMLQLGAGALLHTRWLRVCQHGINLEFNTAVVQSGQQIDAVAGPAAEISITAAGAALPAEFPATEYSDIKITSHGVTGTVAHARVARTAQGITITPISP
jgi:hypothetical protein